MTEPKENEFVAFWENDSYPYLLWGTVTKFVPVGRVETKEYGHGYTFRYVYLRPKSEALDIIAALQDLKEAKKRDFNELDLRYATKLSEVKNTMGLIGERV